jgi:glycerate dehydrogenase
VGAKDLKLLKPTAFVVNTSRGPLIDDDALYDVLASGKIAGAALDVFDPEPLPKNDRWRTTKWGEDGRAEVLLSPHMGYGETETLHSFWKNSAENIGRWVCGDEVLVKMN